MSKTRHQDINQETVGTLFRRMTLAGLGLDAMEDISSPSLALLESADIFSQRLVGGILRSLPKQEEQEAIGFSSRIGGVPSFRSTISESTAGARNATDVGEWKYWLDAVLLMLYNEDEEDFSGLGVSASAVKSRVNALLKSGVSARKLTDARVSQRDLLFKQLQSDSDQGLAISRDIFGQVSALSKMDSSSLRLSSDKARDRLVLSKLQSQALSSEIDSSGAVKLERWLKAVERFSKESGLSFEKDRVLLSELSDSMKSLSLVGIASEDSQRLLNRFEADYFKRAIGTSTEREVSSINIASSHRMVEPSYQSEQKSGHLSRLSALVERHVLELGESEATRIWEQAINRYESLSGFSAEVDRVLLRDLSQAEEALAKSGIVLNAQREREADASVLGGIYTKRRLASNQLDLIQRIELVASDILSKLETSVDARDRAFSLELGASLKRLSERKGNSTTEDALLFSEMADRFESFASARFESSRIDSKVLSQLQSSSHSAYTRILEFVKQSSESSMGMIQESGLNELKLSLDKLGSLSYLDGEAQISIIRDIAERFSKVASYDSVLEEGVHLKSESFKGTETVESAGIESVTSAISQAVASAQSALSHAYEARRVSEAESFAKALRQSEQALRNNDASNFESILSKFLDSSKSEVSSVVLEGDRIDTNYIRSLGGNISLLQRVLGFSSLAQQSASLSPSLSLEQRLEKMLDLLKLDGSESVVDSSFEQARIGQEKHLRLSELSPHAETMEHIRGALSTGKSSYDLTSMLGADKSVVNHLSSMLVEGRIDNRHELQSSLAKQFIERVERKNSSSVLAESLSESGLLRFDAASTQSYKNLTGNLETVNLSLSLSDVSNQGVSLKQNIEFSHLPKQDRQVSSTAERLSAKVEVNPSMDLAGRFNFVPVSLGLANTKREVSGDSAADKFYTNVEGMDHVYAQISNKQRALTSAETLSSIDAGVSKFAGVELSMSPEALVQVLSHSQIPSTELAHINRSQQIALDTMESTEQSSLMQSRYERVSSKLRSLRKVYLDRLVSEQRQTSHYGKISEGFSSSNFATVLQNITVARNVKLADSRTEKALDNDSLMLKAVLSGSSSADLSQVADAEQTQRNSYPGVLGNTMSFFVPVSAQTPKIKRELDRYMSLDSMSTLSHSESNLQQSLSQRATDFTHSDTLSEAERASLAIHGKQNGEVLGRIDSLLDYVENKSRASVGVFSNNETVKVLLDSLPSTGYLGERGLPQWRVKNKEALELENSKELREALRKIGATPVQGVQQHVEKAFVNPFAMKNDIAEGVADPLFSAGSEGGSTPSSTPFSSWGDMKDVTEALPSPQFLIMLAEEVYQRIIENLSEELQRRRTE